MTRTATLIALALAALLVPGRAAVRRSTVGPVGVRVVAVYALAMLLVGCDQLKSLLPKSECEHATEKLCAVKEWEHARRYEELAAGNWCAERDRLEAEAEAAEMRFLELKTWSEEKGRLFSPERSAQLEIKRANSMCIEAQEMAKGFDMEACFARELMACAKKQ